jgi:propanol-preferring alcohol dehydrogenase
LKGGGRLVLVALPLDNLSLPIDYCVRNQIEIVGSMVGTRVDLQETLDMAKNHDIKCKVQTCQLEEINKVFDDMNNYRFTGRMVIDFTTNQS